MDASGRQSMLEMYIFENVQMIEQLEDLLIESEQTGQVTLDAVNEVFRIMHTIKGSSAMMEFDQVAALAHALEDLFDVLRVQPGIQVDTQLLTDQVLQSADFFKEEIAKAEAGDTLDGDAASLINQVRRFHQQLISDDAAEHTENAAAAVPEKSAKKSAENSGANATENDAKKTESKPASVPDILSEPDFASASEPDPASESEAKPRKPPVIDLGENGPASYYAKIFFEEGCQMENMHAFAIVHNLQSHVVEQYCFPADIADDEATAGIIQKQGFALYFTAFEPQEDLFAVLDQSMFMESLDLSRIDAIPESVISGEAQSDPLDPKYISRDNAADETSDLLQSAAGDDDSGADAYAAADREEGQKQALIADDMSDDDPMTVAGGNAAAGAIIPAAKEKATGMRTQSVISVHISKLDTLMDLVGELVISEAMVTHNPELDNLELDSFHKAARQLNKLTNELQDIVMSIRMVPVAATFHKMQRIVRDMTRKLNKNVQLQLLGEETEVDKSIIDQLGDPLMHLIRNGLDHGIESPADRLAAGKPEEGTLTLEARNAGSDVWITIRDDGKGIDPKVILEKARDKGLLDKPENEYSEKEILSFILLPGFSTKDAVSEFSGRGVGMDVVRENIEKIGGTINIDSEKGKGTAFQIRIPLTLAIIDGMLLSVGNASYILPITAIRESFRPSEEQIIVDSEGNEMLMIRGECINVLRLHEQFNSQTQTHKLHEGILIMVEDDDQMVCLFADNLLGEQQAVVKPLPAYIRKTKGLAGCTILGDGSISLILDVGKLLA